jgi:hypothetical protein
MSKFIEMAKLASRASAEGAFVSELAERLGTAGLSPKELEGMSSFRSNPLDYLRELALKQKPSAIPPITPEPVVNAVSPVVPTAAAKTPATAAKTPATAVSTDSSFWKRNPEGALLGLAGAGLVGGAGLYGLYNMYANRKLKERQAAKSGLNPGTLKAAMHKLGETAPANPGSPSAAMPLPKPQQAGSMPSSVPSAPQQARSSTSKPTTSQTPGGQEQQVTQSWRENAATNLQGGQDQQQGGGEQGGGQSQGQ